MSYTYSNLSLPLTHRETPIDAPAPGHRALEDPAFPFEELGEIAELESWRKEVNRPIYHLHKWWAQRLGSVFRGILIAAVEQDPSCVMPAFYLPTRYLGTTVFDPFMGSGTTIGEALKLGMRGIGRDINHVAYFAVRNALTRYAPDQVIATFEVIERDIAPQLRTYYTTRLESGV
ncbi:MAG: DNA methyltransferase, partial [Thermomicrobiales bacterium]